ncbi:hypothetical protein COEREDRAFT_15107 [Coemansia reversa NRRL 1564]|uniref:Mediator of RNA polymerase II transcription subunit 1 n=1 Tax=Coemansia reversa (strain ATCC 12441 / NRRL 1564) TaxID=763665 RepID=A0A2G5BD28_COERN|nr:hypothetical protein COEREDRAFT_15107 [Coemansia reversa NRRL 1564]|eukprot:PIA16915.1 hypothetical protein COEREDRAFT_15107 [Coemansia reversa NRRL 1564]
MDSSSGSKAAAIQRTISDELEELQGIIALFQRQLETPDGIVGLHPLGPINVDKARMGSAQACGRLKVALIEFQKNTVASWEQLASKDPQDQGEAVGGARRAAVAAAELVEMRRIAETVQTDVRQSQKRVFEAAGAALAQTLQQEWPAGLAGRLRASAGRLGLACYTDEQAGAATVTLAGRDLVIDVDVGTTATAVGVKVSFVSEMAHDARLDGLLQRRLAACDVCGFEALAAEMAALDRLARAQAAANVVHNTFAVAATLAELQRQELAALDGDVARLLRVGSGLALPFARHVGASTVYHLPAALCHGLSAEQWTTLNEGHAAAADMLRDCQWLDFAWESSVQRHWFLAPDAAQHWIAADHAGEAHLHPGIAGLQVRFVEPPTEDQASGGAWAPYTLVIRVDPPLVACAQTVRALMTVTAYGGIGGKPVLDDAPRLLEDAPTLEHILLGDAADAPQIRAWTISRVPLRHVRDVLAVVPLLRRQAAFNELLSSSAGADATSGLRVQTVATDPFRIDVCMTAPSHPTVGAVLRISETSGAVLAWPLAALGVATDTSDVLAALAAADTALLASSAAHATLSAAADTSRSIPLTMQWLAAQS